MYIVEVEPSIIHFRLMKETLYGALRGGGLHTTVEKRSFDGIIELHAQHLLQKQSVLHNIVQVMKALKETYTHYFGVASWKTFRTEVYVASSWKLHLCP